MKFGELEDPSKIDLAIPESDFSGRPGTPVADFAVYVGCANWNREHLKNFFPRDVKGELEYYSTQFNSVELNATFYRPFPASQFAEWRKRTDPGFMFFPKMPQEITHFRRLNDFEDLVVEFVTNVGHLKEKLGAIFLQMHNDFGPGSFDRLQRFVEFWRKNYKLPLAIEMRQTEWHTDPTVSKDYYQLLEENQIVNIITDTAGRRDLLHMRLTTPIAFVRFVGTGVDEIDKKRLDAWADRLADWKSIGLVEVYFFVHQHVEKHSPMLAAHFIERFNRVAGLDLEPPTVFNLAAPGLLP
jgi:uncharacterized protein YecE (DUF72 family)